MVCGGLPASYLVSLPQSACLCPRFWWWFAVMCGGFGFFPAGLWWFAVICGGLSLSGKKNTF